MVFRVVPLIPNSSSNLKILNYKIILKLVYYLVKQQQVSRQYQSYFQVYNS
jgi:hypothetical protein